MSDLFFQHPILNSPYEVPSRHWELDAAGQPTQKTIESRRRADFITPIPLPKKQKGRGKQLEIALDDEDTLSDEKQKYTNAIINEIRSHVENWRRQSASSAWGVSPQTARLLHHWRTHKFSNQRPFFCQIEAVETAIWLSEVAPAFAGGKKILDYLAKVNQDANPELLRIALKLATGAGKTTVMAMIIAWQTINALQHRSSKQFSSGFLVITPGLTIRDRLRVLQPNDPDNYYSNRELVPNDMLTDLNRARIIITNYHAFKLRERLEVASGTRAMAEGWREEKMQTLETEGQMLQRVMPELMGMKNIVVLNDEAHHCYREKADSEEEEVQAEAKEEVAKNKEAARVWISGIEAVKRTLGVSKVYDLSATPFFLSGSGYREGTLFPWTMSDFSLMDAIECGIVKLPRVPIADNIRDEMPMFRNIWEHVKTGLPRSGRGKGEKLDPQKIPTPLKTALETLYGHYEQTFELWRNSSVKVPPCFIIVCQNTAISKLVFDYISGFQRQNADGSSSQVAGALKLFQNHDEHMNPLSRPNTLLIDSEQLEAGDALNDRFREMAADEIERFRQELVERSGNQTEASEITDQALLREVMNTVGKPGQLGGSIRCVVSVSMLTEGWDANTVTHILGIRAFGTQLLCEQVIGRALRRQSYELGENGLFRPEYADIFGIPFDFTGKPTIAPPQPPADVIQVKAIRPERDHLEICYPRVQGYRVELPEERLEATFGPDSVLELTPEHVGASQTLSSGIIGQTANMSLKHTADMRPSTIVYEITQRLLNTKFRDSGEDPKVHLFGQLKRIVKQWLDGYLVCKGGTYPAQLLYLELADMACERITAGITQRFIGSNPVKALLDPYNPTGSTKFVRFNTSRTDRWETAANKCHLNWIILESGWEGEFCRVAEGHPQVMAYVKNYNLGFEVPYLYQGESRQYRPDFILLIDDGHGLEDPLKLVVEIKGYRGEDAKDKKLTMESYWIPAVNRLGTYGRWAFAEFTEVYEIEADFKAKVESQFGHMIETFVNDEATGA